MNYFKKPIETYVSTILFHLEAIQIRNKGEELFTYVSGEKGPIYIDNRVIISHPIYKKIIAGFFASILELEIQEEISCIIGGATAGMSFAEQLADLINKPYFYVRKKAKGHGLASRIVGNLKKLTGNAVLVEDLITDGGSKIDFLDEIQKHVNCSHCLVVLDREQGGKEKLKNRKVVLHSLTNLIETLKVGLKLKFINKSTYNYVLEYLKTQ